MGNDDDQIALSHRDGDKDVHTGQRMKSLRDQREIESDRSKCGSDDRSSDGNGGRNGQDENVEGNGRSRRRSARGTEGSRDKGGGKIQGNGSKQRRGGSRGRDLSAQNQAQGEQRSRLSITQFERQTALEQVAQSYESLLHPIRNLHRQHDPYKTNTDMVVDQIMQNYNNQNQSDILANPRLSNKFYKRNFQTHMRHMLNRELILFSIDIEAWEMHNQTVTEIGIGIYDPRRNSAFSVVPEITKLHIRVLENMHRVNGKFVVDHAVNFVGEPTLVMSMRDSVVLIQALFDYFFEYVGGEDEGVAGAGAGAGAGVGVGGNGGLSTYLVGHGVPGDIKWLKSIGIEFPQTYSVLDTLEILKITHGKQNLSLAKALAKVDIPHPFLHNAGNDAYYTLLLALRLLDPGVRSLYKLDLCVDRNSMMSEEERRVAKEEKQKAKLAKRALRELRKSSNEVDGADGSVSFDNDKVKNGNGHGSGERDKKRKGRKKATGPHNVAQSVRCSASDAVLYVFGGKSLPEEKEEEEDIDKSGNSTTEA
ncbi:hypothetical protein KGF57_003521 [Candida theae]|uniref:Gfd2/YDR514C-like C-terminal domain-containing protein n=1 Tax=Candida theae TaxID=1198502 RepID=A0AAD5BDF8_9ASCO|nr:uncharacterized protein KGF57_003521 [Candida theae]KAI5956035.1 hypothetical protein KGF57_003521 [Candida theae]